MTGPLAGVTVVALEQAVAAPFATRQLADLGARVVKIERPAGDFARDYDRTVHGQSSYFVWLNRGKQSVTLDLAEPADLAVLAGLVETADVFVQNLKPGAAGRLGLGAVRLAKLLTAALVCAVLAVVSLVWSPVAGNPTSARSVLAGAVAHAATIAAGVAFGSLLSRPVVGRLSHVVLGGTALLLLELALPVPPLRAMLGLFGDDHPRHLAAPLAVLTVETAALSAALVAVALRVSRQRS